MTAWPSGTLDWPYKTDCILLGASIPQLWEDPLA